MDSDKWRKMSLDNAKLAIEQSNKIEKMETKDNITFGDWNDYLSNHSTKYQSLMEEIAKYTQKNISDEYDDLVKGISSTTKLTDEKKKGIQTLLRWVKKDNLYKIGNRTKEGTTIIDQLKKIILLEQYDSMDKELLNELRGIYVNNPMGRMRK